MNKISYGQFTSILLASDAFSLICFSKQMSVLTIFSFLIAIAIQFAITFPLLKKRKQNTQKWILWIYLIASVIWGALLFIRVWQISDTIYIPLPDFRFISKNLIISALIAIVCLYASSPGIKALSRAAVITSLFGAICIIIIALGSIKISNKENLYIKSSSGISEQIISGLSLAGSVCIFPYLLEQLKSNKKKSAYLYFISRSVMFITIILITILTTGGIMQISRFPIIKAAELCQPLSTQRMDALFILVLVILAIVAISVQTVISSQIIETIFPKFRRFKSTAMISVMLIIAFILGKSNIYSVFYAILLIVPALITSFIDIRKGAKAK